MLSARGGLKHISWILRTTGARLMYGKKIFPLPFAAEQSYFRYNSDQIKKDIPLSCTFAPTPGWCKRKRIFTIIKELHVPGAIVGRVSSGSFLTSSHDESKQEYYKVLARSKISVSCPGQGFDTGRFWEILANNALLFSPPLQIKMPYPFVEYQHFISFRNTKQLKEGLRYYLNHAEEGQKIANNGYHHLLEHHTSKARAGYLLKESMKVLGQKASF